MTRSTLLASLVAAPLLLAGLGAGSLALVPAASTALPAPQAASGPFKVDSVHSSVVFKVKHLNVAWFFGRFDDVSGTFLLDAADPAKSVIDVTIKAESISSANADRDKHLRSQDFFAVKEFPTITFKSTAVRKTGDKTYEVAGDLSMHGQRKSITVTVEDTGTGPGMRGGEVAGLYSTFTVKRSDFGMTFMVGPIGDEVTLMVSLEGAR